MNQNEITVTVGGKEHQGRYEVSRGMVTAWFGVFSKTTQVGASAEMTARMLLRELIAETGGEPI